MSMNDWLKKIIANGSQWQQLHRPEHIFFECFISTAILMIDCKLFVGDVIFHCFFPVFSSFLSYFCWSWWQFNDDWKTCRRIVDLDNGAITTNFVTEHKISWNNSEQTKPRHSVKMYKTLCIFQKVQFSRKHVRTWWNIAENQKCQALISN